MVHVPMHLHPAPKRVLIIGGGDGGILREVVKHSNVTHITQVEIDSSVIDMAKEHFPKHSDGAYDDKRVTIIINDAAEFVKTYEGEKFDVIIADSTDPIGKCSVRSYSFRAARSRAQTLTHAHTHTQPRFYRPY
jgi:spermidine synthase